MDYDVVTLMRWNLLCSVRLYRQREYICDEICYLIFFIFEPIWAPNVLEFDFDFVQIYDHKVNIVWLRGVHDPVESTIFGLENQHFKSFLSW